MALKTFNPTTPGQRQLVMVDRSSLYKGKPVKALTEGKHSSGGRNATGRITLRFRGAIYEKACLYIDFKPTDVDMPAISSRRCLAASIPRTDATRPALYPCAPTIAATRKTIASST